MSHTITSPFVSNSSTIIHIYNSPFSKIFSDIVFKQSLLKFQGFKQFLYTPMEVGEVMASCEARLLKQKIISGSFTAKEIAERALWDHLTQEDYDAPLKVYIMSFIQNIDVPL